MAIAVDIGNKKIKIVKGAVNKKNNIVIDKYIEIDTPEGCIQNGYVKNYTEMQIFFRNLINSNKLKGSQTHVAVRSSDIISREITVPILPKKKLVKVIKNEIIGVFGNASSYYIDYAITGKAEENYASVYKVMAYAIPKDIVINYYDLLVEVDLKPAALDVHRNCIHKLISNKTRINEEDVSDKAIILVDIGSNNLDLDLIVDCKSVFKRSMVIANELETSSMNYRVSENNEFAVFDDEADADFLLGTQNSSSRALFSKVNEELYKMIQFSISREGAKRVERIYLYGGNSRINGMNDYLSDSLGMPVERITGISNIELKVGAEICDIMPVSASLIRIRG